MDVNTKPVVNITSTCRVCLQSPENEDDFLDLDIIYDEKEKLTYSDCFYMCTQIDLEEEHTFAYSICKDCGLELQMVYDFHKKVAATNKILEDFFHNKKEREIVDDNAMQGDDRTQLEEIIDVNGSPLDDETIVFRNVEELNAWEEDTIVVEPLVNAENLASKENLKHTKEKSLSTDKPNYCDICHKTFSNPDYLPRHRKIHDPERKKFQCPDCDKFYYTNGELRIHYRSHNGEGFLCPVCSKIFQVKKDLEVHMRFHTREFPFVCDVCGRKFALKSHLTTHMSAKHEGKRLPCKECGRLFQNGTSLLRHSFVHSQMPFHCAYCVKQYPSKHKLKVHIRTKHGMEANDDELISMRKFKAGRQKHTWMKIEMTQE